MKLAISLKDLKKIVHQQIFGLFVIKMDNDERILDICIEESLLQCNKCFSHIRSKYFKQHGETFFSPFQSSQYATFLYYLSRIIWLKFPEERMLADRVYYLNKALNGVDLFYEMSLPSIFFSDHPVGTVMGRGIYSDFFTFAQNCTVGNNKGKYPEIGKNVVMAAGASILGDCVIGNNVIIGANVHIKDESIPDCTIVFGSSPNLVLKSKDKDYFRNSLMVYDGYMGWD